MINPTEENLRKWWQAIISLVTLPYPPFFSFSVCDLMKGSDRPSRYASFPPSSMMIGIKVLCSARNFPAQCSLRKGSPSCPSRTARGHGKLWSLRSPLTEPPLSSKNISPNASPFFHPIVSRIDSVLMRFFVTRYHQPRICPSPTQG